MSLFVWEKLRAQHCIPPAFPCSAHILYLDSEMFFFLSSFGGV